MTDSPLLQPIALGDLRLPNRVVLAPMTRARSGPERVPGAAVAEYYAQRSSAGLLISEGAAISPQAIGWNESPGLFTPQMVAGWRCVTDAVHAAGGRIFAQLWHCGRASHSSFLDGRPAVAPSAVAIQGDYIHTPRGKQPHETPRALALTEIPAVVGEYRSAALAAREAGFDGAELHGANGYLIDQFLQSKINQRTDDYGGSVARRSRFLLEVVAAVASVFPGRVGVRLSPNGVYNDTGSPDFREQFLHAAEQLNQFELAYLHVVDGLAFGFHQLGEPLTLAEFRPVFRGPLMGNCGYTRETADAAIAAGHADLISFGRPFISNPDLVERFRHGWPLAAPAPMNAWYAPTGAEGYTDFPRFSPGP